MKQAYGNGKEEQRNTKKKKEITLDIKYPNLESSEQNCYVQII